MLNDFLIFIPALLIALSVHEAAHAWAADRLGDPNPRLDGRLSLNPLRHLDPIGTLMLVIFHFGWGKPVAFDPFNLRRPKRDAALISLAGPTANLILAVLAAVLIRFFPLIGLFLLPLVIININLAVFNLLPVPPLDGSKILYGILPLDWADEYNDFMHTYGTILLVLLILPLGGTSLAIRLVAPVTTLLFRLLLPF
jgi:Zn-dependent protease